MFPLFHNIIESTIWWDEPYPHRIVWATMLDIADHDGNVLLTVPELAEAANVTVEEASVALARLLAPDTHNDYSRSDTGAHIEVIPNGWRIFPAIFRKHEVQICLL